MNILFFQNCISPHQMPYIQHLKKMKDVKNVVVIAPVIDERKRKAMGWNTSDYDIETIIAPDDSDVESLLRNTEKEETWCMFSGINAFPDVTRWMKMALKYNVRRAVISEPPLVYNHPLWMHSIRFALKDWTYVKYFDKFFLMGDEYTTYYQRWSKKWDVVPFMYCTEWRERTLPSPTHNNLRVLYVGSLCHRKNVEIIIDATKETKDIEIGIVGDGEELDNLKNKVKNAESECMFFGNKQMAEIPDIMQQYDVLVLPSRHDGWGAVINEALILGLYVICSDHCGAKYLLKEDNLGQVFESENIDNLRSKLMWCSKNLSMIRDGIATRIKWSKENISGEAVAQYFYDNLLKE